MRVLRHAYFEQWQARLAHRAIGDGLGQTDGESPTLQAISQAGLIALSLPMLTGHSRTKNLG